MFKKTLLSALVFTCLSGCEVPVMIAAQKNNAQMTGMFEITFPAVLLVQYEGRKKEELLSGKMKGYANGTAKYDLTGPIFGHCTGGYTSDGVTTLKCGDKFEFRDNVGKKTPKMSGVSVDAGGEGATAFVSAIGWGKDASEAAVRAAIAKYDSEHS